MRNTEVKFQKSSQKSTKWKWQNYVFVEGFFLMIYFVLSVGLTFYQWWFLKTYKYPLTTVTFQSAVKYMFSIFCRFMSRMVTGVDRISLKWSENFFALGPIGFAAGLDIAFSNWGLELITISLYTMTKSTSIIFILLFTILFNLEKKRCSVFFIVFVIAGGLFLFTYKSTQFNGHGFVLVLLASFCSGLRWTLAQFVMQRSDLSVKHPIDMIYHVQPWMIIITMPFAITFEGMSLIHLRNIENEAISAFYLVILSSFIAFALEVTEFLVVHRTSSLTLSVVGILKEVVTLAVAFEWNGDHITLVNFAGLLLCLSGIVGHVFHKLRMFACDGPEKGDEASVSFLPLQFDSSEEDVRSHGEGSEEDEDEDDTEVLFSVLNINDRGTKPFRNLKNTSIN